MAYPVKSHFPLITPRIDHKFNALPAPPQITPQKNFAAEIRRQACQERSPYNRTRRVQERIQEETLQEAPQSNIDTISDESLSELSDSESESYGQEGILEEIPKPAGKAGRSKSGGYNLQSALGWEKSRFEKFTSSINDKVATKLDIKKCYSKQKKDAVDTIIEEIAQEFNIKNTYVGDWPIRDYLKLRLKYTADHEKKKVTRKVEKDLKTVLKASTRSEGDQA